MSDFLTFNETEATTEGSGGKKVLDTGIYDVTIVTASLAEASTGTTGIDWSLQVEGAKFPNMVYGFWVKKANGDAINMNMSPLQGLMGLVGAKKLTEFSKTVQTGNGDKVVSAFKELDGKKVKVCVQKILDVYQGEPKEKNEIRMFFGEDGRTYAETVKNTTAKQMTYFSGLTDKKTDSFKKWEAEGGSETTTEPELDTGSLL